jgi:A/G-specific adenine glycosylase
MKFDGWHDGPRMPRSPLHAPVLAWYAEHARDLPWRRLDATPWGVLVSEVMLQQTSVSRVLPAYAAWLDRWPTPTALAGDPPGEAIRQWGRLGYPRRALRLHSAATTMVARHGGAVPSAIDDLRALPGVGDYTAAAVASFAFRQRHAVLDTNVRRVLARLVDGVRYPPASTTTHERRTAEALLPDDPEVAATWAVAVMEVGALVCAAGAPTCDRCPFQTSCRWQLAGRPAYDGPPRRSQRYDGTDRQCRGRLLQVLRDAPGPTPRAALEAAWPDPVQRARALDTLVADGLVEPLAGDLFRLPTAPPPRGPSPQSAIRDHDRDHEAERDA